MKPLRESRPGGAEDRKPYDEAEFEALLDAAVDGIIITDHTGCILRLNKATERLFDYREEELIGQSIRLIMPEKDARAHDRYMRNYLRTGQAKIIGIGRELEARRKDGSLFPIALSIGEARLRDRLHFVGLIRDLTTQKRAEEEALRQRELMNHASRLTTMGEMAAAMAHELNQPLSAITNYTAACQRLLARGDAEATSELQRALGEIGSQAHRAAEVIQRVRDFARSRASGREAVRIAALIEQIMPLLQLDARSNRVELHIRIESGLPEIHADPIQLQQVLLNLVRNAIDAMQSLPEPERRVDLRAGMLNDAELQIEVIDRGTGVSEEAARQLFTPFFTSKEKGMGMGLAISRSIVAAHGGTLDFRNNPLAGATFRVRIPVGQPLQDEQ